MPRKKSKSRRARQKRLRQHFGRGQLRADPQTSVFINCPFDDDYAPLFNAIIFATTCCGFLPRSALESGDVAESRMSRIAKAVYSSKYSIHDLSRCRGEGNEGLARFNMPLELGMAVGQRIGPNSTNHDWLILVPEGHQYVKFVSDLAGYDPKTHDGTVDCVVAKVMAWLATREDATYVPEPKRVIEALRQFEEERQRLAQAWHGEIPWADLILAARRFVPE